VVSALDSARRIRKLKEEVATLTAHINLIHGYHADRVVALERECREKIGTRIDEVEAIVAKVVPLYVDEEVQITISGRTARKFWDTFAGLRDAAQADEPPQDASTWLDCAALDITTTELFRSIRQGNATPPAR
jgi:hypothetical protein